MREAYTTGTPYTFLLHKLFAATKQVSSRMGQQLLGLLYCRSIWVCISPMQLLENQRLVKLIYSNRLTYLSLRIFWNLSLSTIVPAGANQVLVEPTLVLLEPILVKVKLLLNSRYWLIVHINFFWSWDNDFINKQNTYEVTSWRGKVPAKNCDMIFH